MVMIHLFRKRKKTKSLDLDDVFADALNLSSLDKHSLEGKFTRLIPNLHLYILFAFFVAVLLVFSYRLFQVQIVEGAKYKEISENNSIEKKILFAKRGVIKDRFGRVLAFNSESPGELDIDGTKTENIYLRKYTEKYKGLAHILGYLKYPAKDSSGNFWRLDYQGVGGIEEYFNDKLNGEKGWQIIEKDATGKVISSGHIEEPKDGENITLSIDADLNDMLYRAFENYINQSTFQGGAAAIIDIQNAEIIAMISVPEFDLNKFASMNGEYIQSALSDKRKPLLNRATLGTYAPGSIVKPFVALAALAEDIISPDTKLLSKGALVLPNPYNPDKPTIFKDWKAHGWVNMKEAIAHSSDEYFYVIGGGYKEQEGLGIRRLLKYMKLFGFGEKSNIDLPSEASGLVPSPAWKEKNLGEKWHVGNTYHTSIGQYSFLMTLMQALRATAYLASGDALKIPTLIYGKNSPALSMPFTEKQINVIHDGMRMAVNIGTARPLKLSGIQIAAKTGTAQTGVRNEYKNSWVIGFWPYKNPRFAFAALLEKGDEHDRGSASHAMREFFMEMIRKYPDYAQGKYPQIYIKQEVDSVKEVNAIMNYGSVQN